MSDVEGVVIVFVYTILAIALVMVNSLAEKNDRRIDKLEDRIEVWSEDD
jgi:hypothetical protein